MSFEIFIPLHLLFAYAGDMNDVIE